MCGIIGYTGTENSVPILIDGLRSLEYRGYDSAGIAINNGGISAVKTKGRIDLLAEKIKKHTNFNSNCGIGHTRWATHGEPSDVNSHPHMTSNLAVVHNGIIENYAELTELLCAKGYKFISETDTEAAAYLIDMYYVETKDPLKSLFKAAKKIKGSFAFGIIFADLPHKIYAMRKNSPLIAAFYGDNGMIASDITAVLGYTKKYYDIPEATVAVIDGSDIEFYNEKLETVNCDVQTADWNAEQADKGTFASFMLKEIYEEPEVLINTVKRYLNDGLPDFGYNELSETALKNYERIHIVACGTAMHAGLVGKYMIEKLARIPVNVEIASEFRYREPVMSKNDIVILLSQSGETADTIAALKYAKSCGVYTLAIVNVIGSSLAKEADSVIYTLAGPEIAVASTKAYITQCAALYLFTIKLAMANGKIHAEKAKDICRMLIEDAPCAVLKTLASADTIRDTACRFLECEHMFFIGRGIDSALCTEGSLKLKEISYIHSEAYAAGELKHGTISLISDGTPVVALMTDMQLYEKTISGIREVKSRGASVLAICTENIASSCDIPSDWNIIIPDSDELMTVFPAAVALQLFAYYVASQKGLDVDKPRNLAKSVTVE